MLKLFNMTNWKKALQFCGLISLGLVLSILQPPLALQSLPCSRFAFDMDPANKQLAVSAQMSQDNID